MGLIKNILPSGATQPVETETFTAGEAITSGEAVYLDLADQKVYRASLFEVLSYDDHYFLGIARTGASQDGTVTVQTQGPVNVSVSGSKGDTVYLTDSYGLISTTASGSTENLVIGRVLSSNQIELSEDATDIRSTEHLTTFNRRHMNPAKEAREDGTVFFLAQSDHFPGFSDYAGTVEDAQFINSTYSSGWADTRSSGLIQGDYLNTTSTFNNVVDPALDCGADPRLKIGGELTVSVGVRIVSSWSSDNIYLVTFAEDNGAGDIEDNNTFYSVYITDPSGEIRLNWENASGVNNITGYAHGTFNVGEDHILTFTRDASLDVRAYLDGVKFSSVATVTGGTDGGSGVAQFVNAPTGGVDSKLMVSTREEVAVSFVRILKRAVSDAEESDFAKRLGF